MSGRLRHFLGVPSWLYEARDVKLTGGSKFFQKEVRYAATTKNPKTGVLQTCPGTLPEGEIVIGGLFITMPASGEMRE